MTLHPTTSTLISASYFRFVILSQGETEILMKPQETLEGLKKKVREVISIEESDQFWVKQECILRNEDLLNDFKGNETIFLFHN